MNTTAAPRKRLTIYVPDELREAIDTARGDVSLQRYVVRKLREATERDLDPEVKP